jgi:hypothetical protein
MTDRTARRITVLGPTAFLAASALLTVAEHGYLARHGWKALADSNVNWPSALASGPAGVVEILAFLALGLATLSAAQLHHGHGGRRGTVLALKAAGVLTVLAACPVDVGTSPHTWHGYVNEISLSILTLLAPIALLLVARDLGWDRRRLALAVGLIAVTAVAFMSLGAWSLYFYYGYWGCCVAAFTIESPAREAAEYSELAAA